MIAYTDCNIEKVSAHYVGNKTDGGNLHTSDKPLDITDRRLREVLLTYFVAHFKNPELYCFTFTNDDVALNPVYNYVSKIFDSRGTHHAESKHIAAHLYETALHPNINSGDLYIAYFSSIELQGELMDAIGIFKSETKDDFLKLVADDKHYSISHEQGTNVNHLDKGCLIFNTDKEHGYKVAIVDKANRGNEAQYWKETFLNLKPLSDEYHLTKGYLDVCKNFVTEQLEQEYELSRTDKINFLTRSVDFFKNNEQFDEDVFLNEVFADKDVIQSFQSYKQNYAQDNGLELDERFDISSQAVKKQARVFKSVLKLDKNFHVYIHGNTELIEKGYDEAVGKHYYKIYFDEES